jgi:hypothetical protein
MFCKSGLVALIAGLALSASSASAGTIEFTLNNGSLSGTTATAGFSSAVVSGFGAGLDGTYPQSPDGTITVNLSSLTYPITIQTNDPAITFNGTLTPVVTGSTSGYGTYTFIPPGTPPTFDASLFGQLHSYSYNNLTFSGNTLTGGTFTLSTAAVPEPSAFAMGATALVGLIAVRRRRARSAA